MLFEVYFLGLNSSFKRTRQLSALVQVEWIGMGLEAGLAFKALTNSCHSRNLHFWSILERLPADPTAIEKSQSNIICWRLHWESLARLGTRLLSLQPREQ